MTIALFTVAGSPPIIGKIIKQVEGDDFITVEHPLALMKESLNLYAFQYMPFAKGGIVMFRVVNLISVASVDEELTKYYNELVEKYKAQKINYIHEEEPVEEKTSARVKTFPKTYH